MSNSYEYKSTFNFEGAIATARENSEKFTTAALVGAAIGVATTIASDKSTLLTSAISVGVGALYVTGTSASVELAMHETTTSNLAIVAGVGFGYTALAGYVANRILGDDGE